MLLLHFSTNNEEYLKKPSGNYSLFSFPVLFSLLPSFTRSISPHQTLVSPSPLLPGHTNRRIRPTWVPWRPPQSTPPPPSPPAEARACLPSVTCLDDCQVEPLLCHHLKPLGLLAPSGPSNQLQMIHRLWIARERQIDRHAHNPTQTKAGTW